MVSRFRSWWQNTSKTLDAVIVTSLVALLRIMVSWLRSWWQKIKQHPMRSTFVSIACVLGIVLLIGGYFFNWTWTGFGPYTPPTSGLQRGKTLYDWLQLAIIPAVLVVGGFLLNNTISRTEREIALDNHREEDLQTYIDKMSELLLHEKLRDSVEGDDVRKIARARTISLLPRLDGRRKGSLLQFLYESGLIDEDKCIIDLRGADLSKVDLYMIDLHNANLRGANLKEVLLEAANLREADLSEADLTDASLELADLFGANLRGANLRGANLLSALFEGEDWITETRSLKGAIMPDGTIHA